MPFNAHTIRQSAHKHTHTHYTHRSRPKSTRTQQCAKLPKKQGARACRQYTIKHNNRAAKKRGWDNTTHSQEAATKCNMHPLIPPPALNSESWFISAQAFNTYLVCKLLSASCFLVVDGFACKEKMKSTLCLDWVVLQPSHAFGCFRRLSVRCVCMPAAKCLPCFSVHACCNACVVSASACTYLSCARTCFRVVGLGTTSAGSRACTAPWRHRSLPANNDRCGWGQTAKLLRVGFGCTMQQ